MKHSRIALIVIIIVFALLISWLLVGPQEIEQPDVPLDAVYDSYVVYTTDVSVDEAPLRADCRERGGFFNRCGSPCGPDDRICTSVCAYVCELE